MLPLSYPAAVASTLALTSACGTWLYFASPNRGDSKKDDDSGGSSSGGGSSPTRPASPPRLALAACLATNCLVPLLFDRHAAFVSIAIVAFIITWLSSFKAIAFACGRGPLSVQAWSLPQFVALYVLPIVPTDPHQAAAAGAAGAGTGAAASSHHRHHHHPQQGQRGQQAGGSGMTSTATLAARWAAKTALAAAVVFSLALEPQNALVRELLYVLGMYGMLGCMMDGPASLCLGWLGLSLEPHFRPPWEARSVSQFWGRQWNQAASNALRTAVYEPICEGSLARRPGAAAEAAAHHSARLGPGNHPRGRAAAALFASCFVSGLVHEIIIFYVYRRTTGGEWLAFFTVQAPLILAERWALSMLGRAGVKPPTPARIAATLSVLLALGHWGFFGPAERIGMTADFAGAMRLAFAALAGARAS